MRWTGLSLIGAGILCTVGTVVYLEVKSHRHALEQHVVDTAMLIAVLGALLAIVGTTVLAQAS